MFNPWSIICRLYSLHAHLKVASVSTQWTPLAKLLNPKIKTEYRNETQYQKPSFMNRVRQFCRNCRDFCKNLKTYMASLNAIWFFTFKSTQKYFKLGSFVQLYFLKLRVWGLLFIYVTICFTSITLYTCNTSFVISYFSEWISRIYRF